MAKVKAAGKQSKAKKQKVEEVAEQVGEVNEVKGYIEIGFYKTRGGDAENLLFTIEDVKFGQYIINRCRENSHFDVTRNEGYFQLLDDLVNLQLKADPELAQYLEDSWNSKKTHFPDYDFERISKIGIKREITWNFIVGTVPFFPIAISTKKDKAIGFFTLDGEKVEVVVFKIEDRVFGSSVIDLCEWSRTTVIDGVYNLLNILANNSRQLDIAAQIERAISQSQPIQTAMSKISMKIFKVEKEVRYNHIYDDIPFFYSSLVHYHH